MVGESPLNRSACLHIFMDEDIVHPRKRKKAKGIKTKQFPKHWSNYQKINEDDSEDVKNKKEFLNNILIEKKPYFFKYLYKDCKNAYNKFIKEEEAYRQIYSIDYNEIIKKEYNDLSEKERYYLDSMSYRNPLIDSDCEMNNLCHYMESVDFSIKNSIKSDFIDYNIYKSGKQFSNHDIYNSLKKEVEIFFKSLRDDISMSGYNYSVKYSSEEEYNVFNKYESFKERLVNICSNTVELTDYLIDIFYKDKKSYNKDFLWKSFGKTIFLNVYNKSSKKVLIPKIEDNGEFSYLFDKYNILEVDLIG